jgi:hypothetical protein
MKMKDWDTASFNNFRDIIKYFELEENFEKVFGKDINSYNPKSGDRYEENNLINFCLNWIECPSNTIFFSGFNEETGQFDVNKLDMVPKNISDAKSMIAILEKYIAGEDS